MGIALSILIPVSGLQRPVVAAERIYATYGALEESVSIDSLEKFAKQGKIDEEIDTYLQNLSPQQQARLQRILLTPINLSPVAVSQFLYTPIGETLLQRFGQIIQTGSGQPSFYAIRSALTLAAADQQGLTLLNVLRYFPTSGIQIKLGRSLQIVEELQALIEQTNQAIALVSRQSTTKALTTNQVNLSQLPDIRELGTFTWNKRTITLYDQQRDRRYLADLYLPITRKPVPVIVISHGLGSDRYDFAYLAEQLASYGFAVAVPEHPGSNTAQLRALLNGRSNEVTNPKEFINRPLDVKYLLDVLEQLDRSNPNFQLQTQQVGIVGHSFGGYTALALAGAEINFSQLQRDCKNLNGSWNASLLLQCQALQLPRTKYNLQDPRVKGAIAINPITSSIFGQTEISQIRVPVMLIASSADTAAPALFEQILPFTWLTNPNKYLVLIEGATHFSATGESNLDTDPIQLPPSITGPAPTLARDYIKALSVAFLETYIADSRQYRPYLSAAYVQDISQSPLGLSLVQFLQDNQLSQFVK